MVSNDSADTGSMTTPEENAQLVQNLVDHFNNQQREPFDECYANPVLVHHRTDTRSMSHGEHWEEVLGMFAAIPDLEASLRNVAADGDHVFYRAMYAGTHENELLGAEPTGERLEWEHWSDYRFEDGVIAEAWQLSDTYDLYKQLGVVSEPEQ